MTEIVSNNIFHVKFREKMETRGPRTLSFSLKNSLVLQSSRECIVTIYAYIRIFSTLFRLLKGYYKMGRGVCPIKGDMLDPIRWWEKVVLMGPLFCHYILATRNTLLVLTSSVLVRNPCYVPLPYGHFTPMQNNTNQLFIIQHIARIT